MKEYKTFAQYGGFSGASDHCPVWCRLQNKETEEQTIGQSIFRIYDCETGEFKTASFRNHPMCELYVSGFLEKCLIDTGSGLTILNPAKNCTGQTDPRWRFLEKIGKQKIVIRGGPTGRMKQKP